MLSKYDDSKYSGCDKIKSVGLVHALVTHAVAVLPGHVLFEGFRVSKSWGPYADLRNRLMRAEPGMGWLWVLIHAPLELILERVVLRSADRVPNTPELKAMVSQLSNTRVKALTAFPGGVLVLDPREPPDALYRRLVERLAAEEAK